jgi:DNA-binding response OmpR family regulator
MTGGPAATGEPMSAHTFERLVELLDQLAAAHTTAAICTDEIRTVLRAAAGGGPQSPVVDHSRLCVRWGGKSCPLGDSYPFYLLERLCRRLNQFVSYDQLLRDVWDGDVRTDETIRSVVRHLRRRLRDAGMQDLAGAIRCRGRRYGLILASET